MEIHEAGVKSQSVRYFFTPSSYAERLFYYPTRAGHYWCGRQYHFSYQCEVARQAGHHLNYMLLAIQQGMLSLSVEGRTYTALRGQAVLFDCKRAHEYTAQTDDLEFYWLLFNGAQTVDFYQEILSLHDGHVFTPADMPQIVLCMTRLLSYGESGLRLPEYICSETIYSLLCRLLTGERNGNDMLNGLLERSVEYMDRCFDSAVSVADIAARVGLSVSYFTKLFRAYTGFSPYEYIVLRRIGRAKELLLATPQTIREIAFALGYNSEENFIRSFRKKVGVTPSAFRRFPV